MTHNPGNVLITGGAGFIASHVAILLVEKYPDYKVRFRDTTPRQLQYYIREDTALTERFPTTSFSFTFTGNAGCRN
jgi:nucleoside-diphosphate-sugar epimerase